MEWIYDDGGRSKYFKAGNVGDCAVRAIAIATGKDYMEVYDGLKEINKGKSCRNGTPRNVDKKYLMKLGWTWHSTCQFGKGVQCHLVEDELPKGVIIASISKHLVCVKDGVIYDTYNSSINQYYDEYGELITNNRRAVYGYWTPPVEEVKNEPSLEDCLDRLYYTVYDQKISRKHAYELLKKHLEEIRRS